MSFSEDILLLALDDDTGCLRPMLPHAFTSALAGAMLFDLAFARHLDNDLEDVFLVEQPGGMPAYLRQTHANLAAQGERMKLDQALAVAALGVPDGMEQLFDQLVDSGVLLRTGRFTFSHSKSYIKADWSRVQAVRNAIRRAVLTDDLPESRDVVIVTLLCACGLATLLFSADELVQRRARMDQLIRMEVLGQRMFHVIAAAQETSFERTAASLLDRQTGNGRSVAGGAAAVVSAMGRIRKALGVRRSAVALKYINQLQGFDCPACAWPEPEKGCSRFEFCESGAKALSSEATDKQIGSGFFRQWSVADLAAQSDHWMESQGRLAAPMVREAGATHYRPISYDEAYGVIKREMEALATPDQAVFYVSGVAENESAFLFQLFARIFGSNNLPNSINLCHEPSGAGMTQSLGFAKGDAVLEDFEKAEAIFLFGHNPGSNHPRMLKTLQSAARQGAKIVAINPLLEPGLSSFANPQEATGLLGHATSLAELHVQVRINGDMLFLQGMMKHLLEEERRKPGTVFDSAFIVGQTTGVDALIESLDHTDWADIERGSGVDRTVMEQAADIYRQAGSCIATWGLGITHQMNGTHTVRQILNLLLLRGNIGRTGAGACPMRGHSNILGIRSMGCGEKMPGTFLDSLEQQFRFTAPRRPGLGAVHALRAMHQGEAKVCISLGGNLAAVAPDTGYAAQALRTADLTVMIATKLNRSHVTCGRTALLLPCLGRSEIDAQDGVVQYVSVEDAMGNVRASQGCLEPVAPGILGKPRIVAEMAGAVLGDVPGIEWRALAGDYGRIRAMIERTVPAYAGFAGRLDRREHCAVPNPIRGRDFSAIGGKAKFAPMPVAQDHPDSDAGFRLMSIRSHDQFNTTIFGLDDRYRNIRNQRRVVFMNEDDMEELGIGPEQAVVITSHHGGRTLSAPPFYAIAHAIPRRCAAVYFPEANGLVPRDRLDAQTGTPAYKFIPVSIAIHVVDSRG